MIDLQSSVETYTLLDGLEREIHYWKPEGEIKEILLGLHGAMAHPIDFMQMGIYMRSKGHMLVVPTLRGHHQKRAHVDNFELFVDDMMFTIDKLLADFPDVPMYIISHSMGTLLAMRLMTTRTLPDRVKKIVMSSPYIENAVKISPFVVKISGLLSTLFPRLKTPVDDISNLVTKDQEVSELLIEATEQEIRSPEISMRLGRELLNSQNMIRGMDKDRFNLPMLAFIAGDDHIADAPHAEEFFSQMPAVDMVLQPDNYHDNFNERNRKETFDKIIEWISS